jgi:integrase
MFLAFFTFQSYGGFDQGGFDMPAIRLTKSAIDAIPFPNSGQRFYRDRVLKGLGLRVGTGSKVYFVEGQVDRRTVRATLGRADLFPPEAARKKALMILNEMAEGNDPNKAKRHTNSDRITLDQAFEVFFKARPHLSPLTVDGYSRTPKKYLKDWAKRPLRDISRQMVLQRHQEIAKRHGPPTANKIMRHLRSVYNFHAATRDDFPPNPVIVLTQARAWHRERRRQTVVAAHQLPAWWKAVMQEPEYSRDYLLIALFTGLRRAEIATLRWENVDLDGKVLHIPTTKNGDPLDLPLSGFLVGLIANRRERAGRSEWVFPGTGQTRHLVEVKSFLDRVKAASGVKFTLHDLRRTFITIAESLDIPHYALKRLLNHRSDSDVTGGYIVINAERLREPVERVAARILELADE